MPRHRGIPPRAPDEQDEDPQCSDTEHHHEAGNALVKDPEEQDIHYAPDHEGEDFHEPHDALLPKDLCRERGPVLAGGVAMLPAARCR